MHQLQTPVVQEIHFVAIVIAIPKYAYNYRDKIYNYGQS